MAPQKARNDPDMLKIAKIFDFYHEMLILELVYRGSTKDFIRIVLMNMHGRNSFGGEGENNQGFFFKY